MLDTRYSTILKVAIPLMFSSFIESVVLLTDAAFLSRYSNIAYDANGNAGLLYVTLYMAMFGMSDGSQILTARRIGERNERGITTIFQSNILILSVLALVFFVLITFAGPILIPYFTNNQELAKAQLEFLDIRAFALFFAIISLSIQSYFFALGKTTIILIGSLIIAVSNIFMDYSLIFGNRWVAPMGIEGASLASTLAEGLGMLFFIFALNHESKKVNYSFFKKMVVSVKSVVNSLKIGVPLMFQSFISLGTWTLFFFWIESIGTDDLTVSQNIRSVYFLAFIPIFGFAFTTKTYVSQYIGLQDFKNLNKIIKRLLIMVIFFVTLFFHGAYFYPEKLVALINPNEQYIAESARILTMVATSIFIFGIYSVFIQTISGSGNTRITFWIEIFSTGCYIIYGFISIKILHLDLYKIWAIEYFYYVPGLIVALLYLKLSNWRLKKI